MQGEERGWPSCFWEYDQADKDWAEDKKGYEISRAASRVRKTKEWSAWEHFANEPSKGQWSFTNGDYYQ